MVIRNTSPDDNAGVWGYFVESKITWAEKFELKQYRNPIPQGVIDQNPGY